MKLRLGPLPSTDTVKITIAVPVALKSQLDRYARVHSSIWNEPVEAAMLIPHMLSEFMSRDRGFRNALKRGDGATSGSPPEA